MQISVIIPAAGSGQRFAASTGDQVSKVEASLGGRPVFLRSVELFGGRKDVGQILLAVPPDELEPFKFKYGDRLGFAGVKVVPGGRRERWESVLEALKAVDEQATHIAVHDAVRPLASQALLDRLFEAVKTCRAVVPGLPVVGTLKRVATPSADEKRGDEDDPMDAILGDAGKIDIPTSLVTQTVDRADLVEVQTPQVFEARMLRSAYAALAVGRGADRPTDDASVVEAAGHTVHIVEGEAANLKITRGDDLKMAEAWVAATCEQKAADLAKRRLFADDDER
jgi:2-C-methyl-D-erythritol 4-phosphate cytidylyltransferase